MASTQGGKVGAIFGDDDYLSLEKLSVSLEKESLNDDGTFTLCFWVYLLKSSKTGVLIRQVCFHNIQFYIHSAKVCLTYVFLPVVNAVWILILLIVSVLLLLTFFQHLNALV